MVKIISKFVCLVSRGCKFSLENNNFPKIKGFFFNLIFLFVRVMRFTKVWPLKWWGKCQYFWLFNTAVLVIIYSLLLEPVMFNFIVYYFSKKKKQIIVHELMPLPFCCRCNFMNFARNVRCRKCNEDGPKGVGVGDVQMKKGDWTCPE